MSLIQRAGAAALVAASLAGCQALGGSSGVMPASDVGPPPSLRSALPGRAMRTTSTDEEGQPLATRPTRQLDLPKNARGEARAADAGPRRIRRDEIEGGAEGGPNSGGLAPSLSPGGGVGLGGKF
ncbi:hypothetical protein [Methylobacterium sp. A54F]